jgi:predicted N-acetyltransferase YhbS
MNLKNRLIRLSRPDDAAAIEQLHDEAFGPGRFARTAYRVREAARQSRGGFGLTAWCDGVLAGAVDLTPVTIGGKGSVMMLGPLAVAPRFKGQGYGRMLVEESVSSARDAGAVLVILVGDLPYYTRMGFAGVPAGMVRLPGPVDPQRILARELVGGILENLSGLVAVAPSNGEAARADIVVARPRQHESSRG